MKQKFRKSLTLFVCAAVLSVSSVFAVNVPEQLIPVGRAVGIRLQTNGVLVAEIGSVETEQGKVCPAEHAGLQTGDLILSIDGKEIRSNAELQQLVGMSAGKPLSMLTRRGEEERMLTVSAVCDTNGQYRLGILIRDGMSGIGTVTFVDPETGRYGSLGHGICDGESGTLIPLGTGDLIEASVERVQKGAVGEPGALQGSFDAADMLGTVEKNTVRGIFGMLKDQELIEGLQPMTVADPNEIHTGECIILSNVSGTEVREYQATIIKVFKDSSEFDASLMLHITDDALVNRTGGIVQGMSGSPIIQDGKLVGAVTHVLVNDPTRGYGIFIENMLDAAG